MTQGESVCMQADIWDKGDISDHRVHPKGFRDLVWPLVDLF
jgi:hypothetical protein